MNSKISLAGVIQCTAVTLGIAVVVACGGSGGGVGGGGDTTGGAPGNLDNAKKLALASIMYSSDNDDLFPLTIDGPLEKMVNTDDTAERTDSWVMLLHPYHRSRRNYVDEGRGDVHEIFLGPPSASAPSTAYTWTNQNRLPMYAYNYIFLSPLVSKAGGTIHAESRSTNATEEPYSTIVFAQSKRFEDASRGFWLVNAPCSWKLARDPGSKFFVFWAGTTCSGDWCGGEANPLLRHQTFHMNSNGGTVAFVDGHAAFMTDGQITAGTNYATAVASGPGEGGSTIEITDKIRYLWNLDATFNGLDQPGKSGRPGRTLIGK